MTKIKISSYLKNTLENKEEILNTNAISVNNKIKYFDNNKKVTIEMFDNNIIMYRYNELGYIVIHFNIDNPICRYYINNKFVDINIDINKLIIKENEIYIEYCIEKTSNFIFKFEYERVIK
ncbi:MAG: hypothetical protein PHN42_02275 [Bacilli bacterium]|nr:hypothetical protein [Bacilli bacterium]